MSYSQFTVRYWVVLVAQKASNSCQPFSDTFFDSKNYAGKVVSPSAARCFAVYETCRTMWLLLI